MKSLSILGIYTATDQCSVIYRRDVAK